MTQLKCPKIESKEFLCDREATYQIDGVVVCNIHARRIIEAKGIKEKAQFSAYINS